MGAGFRVFYKDVKTCLMDVGKRYLNILLPDLVDEMSVTGDLTSGKAYIYATAENDKIFCGNLLMESFNQRLR